MNSMVDIHNSERRVQNAVKSIRNSDQISDTNKQDMIGGFLQWLIDREVSAVRQDSYLRKGKIIAEHNDFRLKTMSLEAVRTVHEQIRESKYYHKEYSPETKKEYKKFVRIYLKWANGGDEVPEKAQFLSMNVSEKVKDRTDPQELPRPSHLGKLCREFDELAWRALLLTHWDLGSRIGETLSIRVGDYFEKNGEHYIHVPGNKESPNRQAHILLAPPAIDRWLEEGHPQPENDDAFLFCKVSSAKEMSEEERAQHFASYKKFGELLKEAKEQLDLDCDVRTHTVRKARISWLKGQQGLPEAIVDQRVGHIPGSAVTREYTRLSDADANKQYAEAYGQHVKREEDDLIPLRCQDCDTVNPGYRLLCYSCDNRLQESKRKRETKKQARAKLQALLDEADPNDVMAALEKV